MNPDQPQIITENQSPRINEAHEEIVAMAIIPAEYVLNNRTGQYKAENNTSATENAELKKNGQKPRMRCRNPNHLPLNIQKSTRRTRNKAAREKPLSAIMNKMPIITLSRYEDPITLEEDNDMYLQPITPEFGDKLEFRGKDTYRQMPRFEKGYIRPKHVYSQQKQHP